MDARSLLQTQLLQVVENLPPAQQKAVLSFALNLREREQSRRWEVISDPDAAALQAEFAAEDLAWAEAVLEDYWPMLQREDQA